MNARHSYRLCSLLLLVCGSLQAQQNPKPAVAPAAVTGETSTLVDGIRRAEYRYTAIKGEADVWSAPNRAHELRSRVSGDGLEVFPRSTSADGEGAIWKLRLATTRFGRTDGALELPVASVSVTGARVELDHGYLVEWFINDERGIEQGWTIPTRPIGSGKLSIGLSIEGALTLRIEEGGRSGVLVDACGEVTLRYRHLLALDATGRELEARLVPVPTGIAVEVDDAGAQYPLIVDPLLTGPAWTAESDQGDSGFGYVSSTAGDVNGDGYSDVIVTAPLYDNGEEDEGAAFVYLGSAAGLATAPAWTAESDQAHAWFGVSASLAGDVNGDGYSDIIVGAHTYENGQFHEGRAFVYHGSPAGLSASPAWVAESDQVQAWFGQSVSAAGDVNGDGYSDVLVGAPGYTSDEKTEDHEGRVYLFYGSPQGLGPTPDWTWEPNVFGYQVGRVVSTAGDVNGDGYSDIVIAGVPGPFVFHGSPGGLGASWSWLGLQDVNAPWSAISWHVVSTAGDVNGDGYSDVLVGLPYFDYGDDYGELDEGHVYLYHGSASGLALEHA